MADSDEDEGSIRFSTDSDFIDGQWIDGEFYARGTNQRSRRHQTRENAIYGVFGDDDDDASFRRSGLGNLSSGSGRKSGSSMGFSSLSFVSAGVIREDGLEDKDGKQNKQDNAFTSSDSSSHAGLGFSNEQDSGSANENNDADDDGIDKNLKRALQRRREKERGRERSRSDDEDRDDLENVKRRKKKPVAPLKLDKDYGTWMKKTSAFGLKYLKKFNFKGRLGKDETGVANPIIPKLRPKGSGLSYGGFKEVNESEIKNREDIGLKATKSSGKAEVKSSAQPVGENWKKKKVKIKTVYRTAAEIRAEAQQKRQTMQSEMILDMRGPQTVVTSIGSLKSMEQVAEDVSIAQEENQGSVSTLPELAWNIRSLVQMVESDIHDADRVISNAKGTLTTLVAEKKRYEAALTRQQKDLDEIGKVNSLILRAQAFLEEEDDPASNLSPVDAILRKLAIIADVWEQIKTYSSIYGEYKLHVLSGAQVLPVFASFVALWQPLVKLSQEQARQRFQSEKELVQLLVRWRYILLEKDGNMEPESKTRKEQDRWTLKQRTPSVKETRRAYALILEQFILPPLHFAISSRWQVKDFSPLLELLKTMKPALPEVYYATLVEEQVLARLSRAVDDWNPREDPTPIEAWIHPWLGEISSSAMGHVLYPSIRRKLAMVLIHWHPSDSSALSVIEPWKGVWDGAQMQQFLQRNIVTKLRQTLDKEFTVNPKQQYLEPFRWIMSWSSLLVTRTLRQLLDELFWPKWFHALYTWLSADQEADLEQVTGWYLGWKQEFPDTMQDGEYLQSRFSNAMDLMTTAVEGAEPGALEVLMDQVMTQLRPGAAAAAAAASPAQLQSKASARAQFDADDISSLTGAAFIEKVSQIAASRNIEFAPNMARGRVDGKQIYSLGKVNVYFDKGVLYTYTLPQAVPGREAATADKGAWEPISLPDLIDKAERQQAAVPRSTPTASTKLPQQTPIDNSSEID